MLICPNLRVAYQGDGGAPLVCKIPGTERFEAVGLVSWGISKYKLSQSEIRISNRLKLRIIR